MRTTGPIVILVLFFPLALAADEPDKLKEQVAADLKTYYEESAKQPILILDESERPKTKPPPWVKPLKQLVGDNAKERRQAAAYLAELLSHSLRDEQSGAAPWRATPYWGKSAENPARKLREAVIRELAEAKLTSDALPILRWYLDKEVIANNLPPVVEALGKLDGNEADELRNELAGKPHANAVVAVEALKQITSRKGKLPDERLAALCHHYRASIRDAARKLNEQQGGKDPGPFDATKAVRSESVRKVMDRVLDLMTELPPAKAEFVKVTVKYVDGSKMVKETHEVVGWLTRKEGEVIEVFSPYGTPRSIRNGEKKRVQHSERAPDGKGNVYEDIDVTVETTVTPANIEDEIKAVETSRAKNTAATDLSPQGQLSAQFRGRGATLYEAVLGAWLYRAERDAEAARILLPALDSLYEDRHFVEGVRHDLGNDQGYRMLVAFAGDRDFAQTLKFAKVIGDKFPDTRFHHYAQRLAEQLPRRMDDFKKLKLPTPAEWAELKKKLTREEQIDFLCERLRLLNCFQMGQPGGYHPDESQYAEPCGMKANASWGLRGGKTKVINPLTELTGPIFKDEPQPHGLELTLKDVPQLSKYLRDDWFMLIVTFWRDFAPDRNLSSTRPEFESIINGLAHKDVCNVADWDKLKPEEIDKEIERINRWAKENSQKTLVELEWDALNETVAAGEDWNAVAGRLEALLKQKQAGAYDVMKRYLESDKTNAWNRTKILRLYYENDVVRAKDLAPKLLKDKEEYLRLTAALIVFRTGDKDEARKILGDVLPTREVDWWLAEAVEQLLKEGSPESKKQVLRLFSNRRLPHERVGSRARILRDCAAAGLKEPYEFYLPLLEITKSELPMLDEKGKSKGASYFHPNVAEEFAREIIEKFASDDPAVKEIAKKYGKTADQIPELKKWLQARIDAPKK